MDKAYMTQETIISPKEICEVAYLSSINTNSQI
ncbi:hypothetical protein B0H69_004998 [Clostridium beijerinckii]|jgi:hypothetical protein|nr:hypothetical protein [Clostridium beijerinckii]NRT68769.1 hypothetical protein [Clostridium beijerinckii]NRT85075.1 hypothetical protein [Clostridium beijerinckii]NRU48353.1 hypothetical protein [Clostridium beijerinckii]NRZ33643.1 hypothetical protein [Clostridium beijerinckii]